MKTRSSQNWQTRSGTWDSLNTQFIDFEGDYPVLSSIYHTKIPLNSVKICNNYKEIAEGCLVSMFVDDYMLERFWNNPLKYVDYYKKAGYVMTPDFSLLIGMPKPVQAWNVYRNRLVGYIWEQSGLKVIPTISWSDLYSLSYCFEGVPESSTVAVSNTGCRNEADKIYFNIGYNKMIEQIKPECIIFQCSDKYRAEYEAENVVFIDGFWSERNRKKKLIAA